jgi:malate dehydrogenase
VEQGKTLASRAVDNVRVVVVGNPANTNCLIAYRNAQDIPADRFAALTRLDENRACAQLALKAGVHFEKITNMTVWGNHSDTQYPDAENAKINGKPAFEIIKDIEWLRGDFIETVQRRGTAIIAARGLSSAASAANAIKDHIKSFENKTPEADWFSAAIPSDGSYGVDEGLVFSYPLTNDGQGNISIVQDLPLNDFAQEKIALTHQELRDLKEIVKDLLP